MTALTGLVVVGRPLAMWPATLQVMPEGVVDTAFGRFFIGLRISNAGTQPWPSTEIRISPRGRRILTAAAIVVNDGWTGGDAAALGQSTATEWVPLAALAAGANQLAFFKIDATSAVPGVHTFEVELRAAGSTSNPSQFASAPLTVARTLCRGSQRVFVSTCDRGQLTVALNAVSLDHESFRRVLGRARAIAALAAAGTRTPAETERLRQRLRGLFCGDESNVCSVLADIGSSCALPTQAPGSGAAPLAPQGIWSDQATTLGASVRVLGGGAGSNHAVQIGIAAVVEGSVTAGGDVHLLDTSNVQGNVVAGGVIQRDTATVIGGTATQHAAFVPTPIATKTVTPGTTNVSVAGGTTKVLAPGSYGSVTVLATGTLSLSTGTYHFAQLVCNQDVTLLLNQQTGAIDVRVRDSLTFGDRLSMKLGTAGTGSLPLFYSNQTSEILVGPDSILSCVLTAPQGTLHLLSRVNMTGALLARFVTIESQSTITTTTSPVVAPDVQGVGASGLQVLGYPTGFAYSVAYKDGFLGTTGPLAFGAVSWKALLASAMLQFDLGLPGPVAAEWVSMADQAVVGSVKASVLNAPMTAPATPPPSTQAGSVDAAVATARGNRALGFPLFAYLDAATGEPNAVPVGTLDGRIETPGLFLTNAEIDQILAKASTDPGGLKVHKSGARTGVTRGLISALVPVVARDDATGTLQFLNQLVIVSDPAAPPADGILAEAGDSGALWIQTRSNKLVGLAHAVAAGGSVASRIEDVVKALQVHFA